MGNIIVIAALAAAVWLAVRSLRKNKKKGGCSGNCGSCRGCH